MRHLLALRVRSSAARSSRDPIRGGVVDENELDELIGAEQPIQGEHHLSDQAPVLKFATTIASRWSARLYEGHGVRRGMPPGVMPAIDSR
jgi:hypothetical protein